MGEWGGARSRTQARLVMFGYCTLSAALARRLGAVPVTPRSSLARAHLLVCDRSGALWIWPLAPNFAPHDERR